MHGDYYLGSAAGDYICSGCDGSFPRQERQEMREELKDR